MDLKIEESEFLMRLGRNGEERSWKLCFPSLKIPILQIIQNVSNVNKHGSHENIHKPLNHIKAFKVLEAKGRSIIFGSTWGWHGLVVVGLEGETGFYPMHCFTKSQWNYRKIGVIWWNVEVLVMIANSSDVIYSYLFRREKSSRGMWKVDPIAVLSHCVWVKLSSTELWSVDHSSIFTKLIKLWLLFQRKKKKI